MSAFNPDARTAQEHFANCEVQLEQLKRWMVLVESMPKDRGVLDSAITTAQSVSQCADVLVATLAVKQKDLAQGVTQ